MKLDLNPIIGRPGRTLPFQLKLELEDLAPVHTLHSPFAVRGQVRNVAGTLELSGVMDVDMTSACARCAAPVAAVYSLPVTAHLSEELEDTENPDMFLLDDGAVDLHEVFTTAFLLHLEPKTLCDEDCLGLCPTCGADLNRGPCHCKSEVDPRLAALQQLLDGEERSPEK